VHSNLFRHIKTLLSKTSRSFILALFVLTAVLSVTTITNAQLTPTDIQNKYGKYLNLFTSTAPLSTGTGLYIKNATTNDVIGFKLNINLKTTAPQTSSEDPWDYVETPTTFGAVEDDEVFLIRACDSTKTNCWVSNIPYETDPGDFPFTITRENNNDDFNASQSLNNYPIFSTKTPIGTRLGSGAGNAVGGGTTSSIFAQNYKYNRIITDGKNEGTISDFNSNGVIFTKGATVELTLWYCAQNSGDFKGETAYQDIGHGFNDTIATFGTLCDGQTFFRVGTPYIVSIPTNQADIDSNINTTTTATKQNDNTPKSNLPSCSIDPLSTGTIVGCLAQLVYYGIYTPIAWLAGLFGSLFDFFIGYSVSDESYRYAFAVTGWKLVRDIANIFFIIIMVYTGFAAVFSFGGAGGASMKKVIPFLIINALIINFSLFATRTVIDISNITARVFYSRMIVCDGPCGPNKAGTNIPENVKRSPLGGYWPLSEKIVASFDPQKMFSPSVLNSKEASTTNKGTDPLQNQTSAARIAEQQKGFGQDSGEYAAYYALVSLVAAIIMALIGVMFFKVMFMFVGRVMGLYIAMIFSPFAFLTMNGAGGKVISNKIELFQWSTWSRDLFNYAMLAPVFVFFLYIVYSFLETDLVKEIGLKDETGGFFGTVLLIAIPMLIIYFLIDTGAKLAKTYAGAMGNFVQDKISGAVGGIGGLVGGGIGLAAGAGALLGTGVGARLGRAAGKTQLGDWAAKNADSNRAARFFNNTLSKTQTGSWDFRNTKLNKLTNQGLSKATGGKLNINDSLPTRLGFGSKTFEGGAVAMKKAAVKAKEKSFENKVSYAHLSNDKAKELWEKRMQQKAEETAETNAANAFALQQSIAYQGISTQSKNKQTELDAQKAEHATIISSLNNASTTSEGKIKYKKELDEKQKEIETTSKQLMDLKIAQKEELERVKKENPDFKKSTEYQTEIKKEKDLLTKKYGEIKTADEYTNAMRREYVEDKRNNSLWMVDGKQRKGMALAPGGAAIGGAALAGLSALSASVGGYAAAVVGDRIKFEQEVLDEASKNFLKKYGKKKGAAKFKSSIEDLDKIINEKVAKKASVSEEEAEKMSTDEKKRHFEEYKLETEVEFAEKDSLYKNAETAFRANPTDQTLKQNFTDAIRARKQAEDTRDKAKNVWKDKVKAEEDLDKENDKDTPKP